MHQNYVKDVPQNKPQLPRTRNFSRVKNTLVTQTRPIICGYLTYELDGFFKVLFQILAATVRSLKTLAHQAVLKVERNVCGNVKYVSDSKVMQRLLIGGISFISFTE